jgi:hypothetical protein
VIAIHQKGAQGIKGYLSGKSSACQCGGMNQKDASIEIFHLYEEGRVSEVSEPIAQNATLRDDLKKHQRSQNPL